MCNPVNGEMNIFTDHARNYFLGAYGSSEYPYNDVRLAARYLIDAEMSKSDGDTDRAIAQLALYMKNVFLSGFVMNKNPRLPGEFTLVAIDLMIAAVDTVDWNHIAEGFIAEDRV